ncbi:kinase-like domain-containing protein [Massariosphaeria phaeospora]|uniref:non-specific serine/threonine protein kinase n=1 Tax=Massariosphaeria phaeospora TaxID=100035 RepID=A0A7C8M9U0_9PLEO|nr:kinase-like domain-containing protein [Massariosphaeria phaeospora]
MTSYDLTPQYSGDSNKMIEELINETSQQWVFLMRDKGDREPHCEKHLKRDTVCYDQIQRQNLILDLCYKYQHINLETRYRGNAGSEIVHTPFYKFGSLEAFLKTWRTCNSTAIIPEGFLWRVFTDMSNALLYIHSGSVRNHFEVRECRHPSHEIRHRDIRPANIFMTSDNPRFQYPHFVLCNFINATWKYGNGAIATDYAKQHLDLDFKPPEAGDPDSDSTLYYQKASDVYMLGLTIHCLACRLDKPEKGLVETDPVGRHYTPYLKDVTQSCLKTTVHDRPNARDLCQAIETNNFRYRMELDRSGCEDPDLVGKAFDATERHRRFL